MSYRTPTQIIGSADITYIVEYKVKVEELTDLFNNYASEQNFPILKITNEPLVSSDYIGEKFSAIVDTRWLDVVGDSLIKLVLWYDNEYGYSCNVLSQVKYIANYFHDLQ